MASDATNNQMPAGIPVAAWRYRTNNTHTHLIAIEPPSDAYDAGTLAPLVLLSDAQAALAAKDDNYESAVRGRADMRDALRDARKLLSARAVEIEGLRKDAERLDWLDKNIFHREKDLWDSELFPDYAMWVMFSPKGHQGSARNILDAAIAKETTK